MSQLPPIPPPYVPARRRTVTPSGPEGLPPIPFERTPVPPLDLALLHDLPSLELRARFMMNGFLTGLHRSPQKGSSVEFAEYRAYQLGDDLRRIDWRLYGRTDRLHVKQFEHETQLRVFLVLDTSASLGHMDAVQTGGPSGLAKGLTTLAEVLPKRSLVVIASDFYEDKTALDAALRRLRFDHQEVVAFHALDPVEIDLSEDWSGTFVDAETGQKLDLDAIAVRDGYLKRFRAFLDQTQASFLDHVGDYTLLRTDASPMPALGNYLARRDQLG